jgi:hypothetical protein
VEEGSRYNELRGVLIQAEVELIEDFDRVYAIGTALHARYASPAEAETLADAAAGIRAQAAKRFVLRVPYTRVTSWDHRKLAGV